MTSTQASPQQQYRPLVVSPSRIKDASRCMRYWAFCKLGRLPREETEPLRDGQAAHSVAENYLKHGTQPDVTSKYGRWVIEGLPLLPKPKTCLVEFGRNIPFIFDGLPYTAITDFIHLESRTKGDHKFVSARGADFALTPETLLTDVQACLNVLAPPVFPETWLRWIYYPKSGKAKPFAVDAKTTPEAAAATLRRLYLPVVHEMHTYHKLFAGAHDDDRVDLCQAIPCSTTECFAFNRPCDYSPICKR